MSCNQNPIFPNHESLSSSKQAYLPPKLEPIQIARAFFMQPTSTPKIQPANTNFNFEVLEWKARKF